MTAKEGLEQERDEVVAMVSAKSVRGEPISESLALAAALVDVKRLAHWQWKDGSHFPPSKIDQNQMYSLSVVLGALLEGRLRLPTHSPGHPDEPGRPLVAPDGLHWVYHMYLTPEENFQESAPEPVENSAG